MTAHQRAHAGGAAALGPEETLGALARAVEAVIAAAGDVSALPTSDCKELLDADGMVALLRY